MVYDYQINPCSNWEDAMKRDMDLVRTILLRGLP